MKVKINFYSMLILIFAFTVSILSASAESSWGPKIKFVITNELAQECTLYFGVDENAIDDWDDGTVFDFDGKKLEESYDFPGHPPTGALHCMMKRDVFGTYSYVDFRHIPENQDKFFCKFTMLVGWANTAEPNINIYWGKLPEGIDSAKISSWEEYNEPLYDMKKQESVHFYSPNLKRYDIEIWFNKNNSSISAASDFPVSIFPNPTEDFLYINDVSYSKYTIYSQLGEKIISGENNNSRIDVKELYSGIYFIALENENGTATYHNFIKR